MIWKMAKLNVLRTLLFLSVFALCAKSAIMPHQKSKRVIARPAMCPSQKEKDVVKTMADNTPAPESLKKHTSEFTRERIEVTNGVHHFIGYAMANSIIVEAPEGLIVIDTTDGDNSSGEVMKDLRAAGVTADVKAIIYTHDHPDHVGGASGILEGKGREGVEVWGYHTLVDEFWGKFKYNRALLLRRSIRMFGQQLNITSGFVNAGLGSLLESDEKAGLLPVPPDNFLTSENATVTIAGIEVHLIHIPGETRDQMAAYFPSLKVMASGDDFYKTFPNLYSIRGTPPRPVEQWLESIDTILSYDIEYITPSHTRPVIGKDNVLKRLTKYRDGIQFVFDQTIRNMNKGLHPDEVAQGIVLPPSLISDEDLLEHYGTVEWSSKTIFEGQLGWFSGYPEELYPLTPKDKAARWTKLVGKNKLIEASEKALKKGTEDDVKWALLLVTHVWNVINVPKSSFDTGMRKQVRELRAEALLKLASFQTSPNGRNYLMTFVFEENCIVDSNQSIYSESGAIDGMPINYVIRKMATLLKPEKVFDVTKSILLTINSEDNSVHNYSLKLRNAILEVKYGLLKDVTFQMTITIDEQEFRDVLNRRMTLGESGATVEPSVEEGEKFFTYFDDTNEIPF